ncbi:MAG: ABC transporter ATP-binding protein [Candidatus Limnocylindria bacterium]
MSPTRSTPDALWSAPALSVLRPAAITCTDLRRGRELDGCSLSVPVGARLLVVSDPDGTASTLLRALAGLSRVDSGQIRVAGLSDPGRGGWGRHVAYVGPDPGLHTWMTPIEALHLASDLLDLPSNETSRRIEHAIARVHIPAAAATRPMSRGGLALQQRTGLAAALISDPEVLLLDEPLRALDERERTRLLTLPGQRRTILLASRYPATESGLVAHVAFLRDGRVQIFVPVDALERAGLPQSHRGIVALAEMHATRAPTRGAAPV